MLVFCSLAATVCAQTSGRHAYDFLQLPVHARLSALGGVNVSLADRDINFLHNNPALAGDTLNGIVSAGYEFYVADVGNAIFSYAHEFKNFGQLLVGIQHTGYGTLQGYDETGMETLASTSSETTIVVGKTHQIGNFRLGATVKAVLSSIAGYRSSAIAMDLGGIFVHPDRHLTFGLALKNMGVVLSDYSESSSSSVPFDVQAGVTIKPEYMPLRFSLTGYHLTESRLLEDDLLGGKEPSMFEKVFSRLNLGAEILLHRNVNVLAGYNYLLHQALLSGAGNSAAGLSYGFSLFVKPVEFVFSRSAYTVGNAGYSFTLSADTNQIFRKKKLY